MTQITTGPDGQTRFDGMTVKSLADDLHQMALRFADRGFSASSYMTMETAAAALRHLSEWQPIETADTSKPIDLWVCAFGVAGDPWVRMPDCEFVDGEWLWQGEPLPGTATHWRYPPDGPKGTEP
jgi:hypothetical protein